MTLLIRLADHADAKLLSDFGRKTFYESYADQNDPEDMHAYLRKAFSTAIQASELAQPHSWFLIAEEAGLPVGYLRLHDAPAPDCILWLADRTSEIVERPLELARFYVVNTHWGRGIGRLLMQRGLEEARLRGYTRIWLSVWQENQRAIGFYQKMGFEVAGTASFTIGRQVQTDFVMQKRLNPHEG